MFLFRGLFLPNLYVGITSLAGGYCFNVTADRSRDFRAPTASLVLDHLKVVRQQPVTCDRSIIGNPGKGADDARPNKDREVEAVLGVPLRGWLIVEYQRHTGEDRGTVLLHP